MNNDWFPSKTEVFSAVGWLALLIFTVVNRSNKTIAQWGMIVLLGSTVIALFRLVQSSWRAGNRRDVFGLLGAVIAVIVIGVLTGGNIEKATTKIGLGFLVGGFIGCIQCLWTAAKQWVRKEGD